MRNLYLLLIIIVVCAQTWSANLIDPVYKQEIEKWREQRLVKLKSEDGWLTLIGLFWLKEGDNRFGSGRTNEVVFPSNKVPKLAGTFHVRNGKVSVTAANGAGLTSDGKPVTTLALKTDEDGEPTILRIGSVAFHIVKRGNRLGVRAKDKDNPARAQLSRLDYFAINPKWRVNARFEKYPPTKKLPILNILGMIEDSPSPGAVVFQIDGKSYRLDALEEKGSSELFIIFADQTTGKETYGAGRYLYAPMPSADSTVVVDFNKAYSPPCAFTNYATCPLPPRENKLKVRIDAGEKKPPRHG